jgi:hypothetical protein
MMENEIAKEFLLLFSKSWYDPTVHQGFRELREKVGDQKKWPEIIDLPFLSF